MYAVEGVRKDAVYGSVLSVVMWRKLWESEQKVFLKVKGIMAHFSLALCCCDPGIHEVCC